MIFKVTARPAVKGGEPRAIFLVDAPHVLDAYEVGFFAVEQLLRLHDAAIDCERIAHREDEIRCEVVQTFMHRSQPHSTRVMGVAQAAALAQQVSALVRSSELFALVGAHRIALPPRLPLLRAQEVQYLDDFGALRSLGHIRDLVFEAPVPGLHGTPLPAAPVETPKEQLAPA